MVRATRKPILSHWVTGEMGPIYWELSFDDAKLYAPLRMMRSMSPVAGVGSSTSRLRDLR